MDSNKDDAAKCLRIGKAALESGDHGRAVKFLGKARRLDPSLPIDELIAQAESNSNAKSPDPPPQSPADSSTASAAAPADGDAASSSRSPPSSAPAYTEEQVEIVRQVKRNQRDYYQILGLERSCSVEDVRKAYRKISLKVHPDKNNAPGAEDAFKAVSKAFQCLSDEESRKRYDLVGPEDASAESSVARRRRNAAGYSNTGFYDADFDADEIFRNFFFGGMGGPGTTTTTPFGTFHFRTGGMGAGPTYRAAGAAPGGGGGGGGSHLRMLIQLLPVIFLLLMNFLPSSEPIYSLSPGYPYENKIETARGVAFYVKSASKLGEDYPSGSSERAALERRVERDYVSILTQNCRVELQRRQWRLAYETPHCDMLQKFEARSY